MTNITMSETGKNGDRSFDFSGEPNEEEFADYNEDRPLTIRPSIKLSGRQLRDITTEAIKVLQDANGTNPTLFRRNDTLARIRLNDIGRPVIQAVDENILRAILTEAADFWREGAKGGRIAASPPQELIKTILAQKEWPFPVLVNISEAPFMRPGGTIVSKEGYDTATRVYCKPDPKLKMPAIPDYISDADSRRAVDRIEDMIADFPFNNEASKAHVYALLITSVIRPAISGCTPLALITAPTPGSGKGLLASLIPAIVAGCEPELMAAPDSEAEWGKKITSTLLEGPAFIQIDNIRDVLHSSSLEAVLTAQMWKDRILGASKNTSALPNRAVWVATGNNVQLGGDLPRRCYRIHIDTGVAHPELRTVFRHENLLGYVQAHRGEILAALLTIARKWYQDGMPIHKVTRMGSFEDWAQTVGSMLAHAGIKGFLSNIDEMFEATYSDQQQWCAFFATWYEMYAEKPVTSKDIAGEVVKLDSRLRIDLPEVVSNLMNDEGKLIRKLGTEMRSLVDRPFELKDGTQYCLKKAGEDRNGTTKWQIVMKSAGHGNHVPQAQTQENSGLVTKVRDIAGHDLSLRVEEKNDSINIHMGNSAQHVPQCPAEVPQTRNISMFPGAGDDFACPACPAEASGYIEAENEVQLYRERPLTPCERCGNSYYRRHNGVWWVCEPCFNSRNNGHRSLAASA